MLLVRSIVLASCRPARWMFRWAGLIRIAPVFVVVSLAYFIAVENLLRTC